MWTPEILVIVGAAYLLAGFVKGVIGLGLPTVSLAILAATIGLNEAMALMLIPTLVTNLWQGFVGGALAAIVRRIWPLLVILPVGIWFGTDVLARSEAWLLSGLLGVLLCVYSAVSLATPQMPPPGRWERPLSPLIGAATGLSAGMTGSSAVPGVLYLQALGLGRDHLVQAMGIMFTVNTVALAVGLAGHDLLPVNLGILSAVALAPAFLGMMLGQRVRTRLPEQRFRRIFFGALLILGLYLGARAISQIMLGQA